MTDGYGQLGVPPWGAHRAAFFLWKDEPQGLIRHKCHRRPCCNPNHLEDGDKMDNWLDSETVHKKASLGRKGKPANNRQAVFFRGKVYESKSVAYKLFKGKYNKFLDEVVSTSYHFVIRKK